MVSVLTRTSLIHPFQALPFLKRLWENQEFDQKSAEDPIALYDVTNWHECPWPKTVDGAYGRKILDTTH